MQRNQSEEVFYTAELIREGLLDSGTNQRTSLCRQNQSELAYQPQEPIRMGLLTSPNLSDSFLPI